MEFANIEGDLAGEATAQGLLAHAERRRHVDLPDAATGDLGANVRGDNTTGIGLHVARRYALSEWNHNHVVRVGVSLLETRDHFKGSLLAKRV